MVKKIHKLGRIFYLHSSIEGIVASIESHPNAAGKIKKRPLLQDLEMAKKLYQQRLPLYRHAADHEIKVEGKESKKIAREIAHLLKGAA
jgi:shikimate kinase